MSWKDSLTGIWHDVSFDNTSDTYPQCTIQVSIGGEEAIYCPVLETYIPSRCCPHICQKKGCKNTDIQSTVGEAQHE